LSPPLDSERSPWFAAAPGVGLAVALAVAAFVAGLLLQPYFAAPTMVIALILGIALNPLASAPRFEPGLDFCTTYVLRWAVALLGFRIALGDIVGLGMSAAVLVALAMVLTLAAGFWFARALGLGAGFGALAGAATAVCGASAALATSTVVPNYPDKDTDVAFTIVAVNALSTVAMVAYPILCAWLGFEATATGLVLGATIHDVAQVAGAGYGVSEGVGNAAVIVKLFRVFLLLPVVLVVGWYFARARAMRARVLLPGFALAFLAMCVLNTALGAIPSIAPVYGAIKAVLVQVSTWGLLVAISALGLGTSFTAVAAIGWRHLATIMGATIVILAAVIAGVGLLT
jgi:uncharacterized integral membrane protein (TIGR00698 family)